MLYCGPHSPIILSAKYLEKIKVILYDFSIASARPTPFLGKVVTALEMLHATLPPTLSR